jgi:hypothetical protein
MARIKNGFLGNASGKLGNVVFAKWRDVETARSYQPQIHDAKTAAQLQQRSYMNSVIQVLKPWNDSFIKTLLKPFAKKSTQWAEAIKLNIDLVEEGGCVPVQNLVFSKGNLPAPVPINAQYDYILDIFTFSVDNSSIATPENPFPFPHFNLYGKNIGNNQPDPSYLLYASFGDQFCCVFVVDESWAVYTNSLGPCGLLMLYNDSMTEAMNRSYNPLESGTTQHTVVIPVSKQQEITNWNGTNMMDQDCFSVSYTIVSGDIILRISLDTDKIHGYDDNQMQIYLNGLLIDNLGFHYQVAGLNHLADFPQDTNLGSASNNVTGALVFFITDLAGTRISSVKRKYYGYDEVGNYHGIAARIFNNNIIPAGCFAYTDNTTGVAGNFETIFEDLGNYLQQIDPPTPETFIFNFIATGTGTYSISGGIDLGHNSYRVNKDAWVFINCVPTPPNDAIEWAGPNGGDVIEIAANMGKLIATSNKSVTINFIISH